MKFWDHLNSNTDFDLQGISASMADRFAELLTRGHSVADLLAHYGDEFGHLPVDTLRNMTHGLRTWLVWRKRRQQLEEARAAARLTPLPGEIFPKARTPDQLDAIVRTARLCSRDEVDEDEQYIKILETGVELWARCMAITRKEGVVHCKARDLEAPGLDEFDEYVSTSEELGELAPHRWLAMRRGQKTALLLLSVTTPDEKLLQEVERVQADLGPGAAEREARSLLDELVLDDLTPWLLRILDSEAQDQAISAASQSLAGLLRTSPLQVRTLGAVYFTKPRAPVAVVVTDREGDLTGQRTIKAKEGWQERVMDFFNSRGVQHVVLPATALTPEFLSSLEGKLIAQKLQVVKVRSAALSEARRPLTDPPTRLGASVAAAVVLARRALDPLKEWSSVDPVSIGVAEYQHDLDTDILRASLRETSELCRLERRRGRRVHMGAAVPRGNAAMAKLNPLVKSLTDLRGGMTVHGVVSNISHFGAFVNIGLPQEALVHISELSDSFVSNPNEVVSIGQQVNAHVLAVEPSRGRISLSLKTLRKHMSMDRGNRSMRDRPPRPRPMGPSSGGPRPDRGGDPPISKAEALANLEKLFKK